MGDVRKLEEQDRRRQDEEAENNSDDVEVDVKQDKDESGDSQQVFLTQRHQKIKMQ